MPAVVGVCAVLSVTCHCGNSSHRLHNICQEDVEFRRILQATRPDAAFDAALLESLQEHDPVDLTWRRYNEAEQPYATVFNPRTDALHFVRGNMVAGFRNDLVQGKRKVFTLDMEARDVKRPKHSVEAATARARRVGE